MTTEIATPKVSIIIPAYNTAAHIAEALDSVFSQTYRNYEVIVINDGSPDTKELESVLEAYRDRFTYLKQENQGAGPARNTGLKDAKGELIAFLDSDDIWLTEFLESQVAFLEKNNFDVVWSDAYLFGYLLKVGRTFMEKAPSKGEADLESLLEQKCNIIMSGTVARKKAIMDVGGFEKYNIDAEDFDLWVRMALKGARFGYQKDILLKHRIRLESLSGNSIQRVERGINAYKRILQKLELRPEQIIIVERRLRGLEASLRLEHGKALLLNEDFEGALLELRETYKYFRSIKLLAVLTMLHFAPRLLVRFFKWRRAADLPFITRSNPTAKL